MSAWLPSSFLILMTDRNQIQYNILLYFYIHIYMIFIHIHTLLQNSSNSITMQYSILIYAFGIILGSKMFLIFIRANTGGLAHRVRGNIGSPVCGTLF